MNSYRWNRVRWFIVLASLCVILPGRAASSPNILIITVDDMSADSVGAFGCKLPGTTPNIDRLAGQGLRFEHAHVQVGNCMPSRNVMFSGRYPHTNGVEGFYQVNPIDYPVMCDLLKRGGYFTAIRGKVNHSTPYHPYGWDQVLDTLPNGNQAHRKDVDSYYSSTKMGIEAAAAAGKPFCININVSDPHKPFWHPGDPHKTSRVFTAKEVPVPGFLFDDPVVRQELALYYSSVRRADDCVGAILRALNESGKAEETMVLFLSDHGMPLPFAKTQLYHHSTHTPWIVRWPGVTKAGTTDNRHMISAIDLLPTLLDIAGIKHPAGFEGRSFLPLIRGQTQAGRDMVFKEYNENAGGSRDPMRGVQTKQFLYLFNPWSNGQRDMATATKGTKTYRRMKELAKDDPVMAARLDLIDHRVPEELYDIKNDPDALRNLIDEAAHAAHLNDLRHALEQWMVKTEDPLLEVFRNREDAAAREAYVSRVEEEAIERRKQRRARRNNR